MLSFVQSRVYWSVSPLYQYFDGNALIIISNVLRVVFYATTTDQPSCHPFPQSVRNCAGEKEIHGWSVGSRVQHEIARGYLS